MKYVVLLTFLFLLLVTGLIAYREFSPGDKYATPATCGVVVYDWNKPVLKSHRGFPWDQGNEIKHNYDWTKPINYAHGTVHLRAQIKKQPEVQDMRLQLCFWQSRPGGNNYSNENCAQLKSVKGNPGNVVTWDQPIQNMWKKDGVIIDWIRERFRVGAVIKNKDGVPVSNFVDFNWAGEDPDKWYPLDMRFSAVVVPQGGNFCGWDYYLKGAAPITPIPPTSTPKPTNVVPTTINTPIPTTMQTPIPTSALTPVPTAAQTPIQNTPTTLPTTKPTNTMIATQNPNAKCGKADIDGNGFFDLNDFSAFAIAYGNGKNLCSDTQADHISYGPCGGKDVNRDGKLDLFDFGGPAVGFAQRYGPHKNCNL